MAEVRRLQAVHKTLTAAQKLSRATDRLRSLYGRDLAAAYSANPFTVFSPNGHKQLRALQLQVIQQQAGVLLSEAALRRVIDLNRIAGLPLLNIGWHCHSCGVVHTAPMFFDIDHILPRVDGGKNNPENLQILCPNCHRKKTLGFDGISQRQNFRVGRSELQLQFP